jgi:hypothetical protein
MNLNIVWKLLCKFTFKWRPLVSTGKKKATTAAINPIDPYSDIVAKGEILNRTWATNGVIMAPTLANPLQVPKPIALIVVG